MLPGPGYRNLKPDEVSTHNPRSDMREEQKRLVQHGEAGSTINRIQMQARERHKVVIVIWACDGQPKTCLRYPPGFSTPLHFLHHHTYSVRSTA